MKNLASHMVRAFSARRRRRRRLTLALVAVALVGVVVSGHAIAASLTVCPSGCQYTKIPAALAAAHNGDTIAIGPGTYTGGFTVRVSVRLVGARDHSTRISGGGGSVVTIARGVNVAINRITIRDGRASDHGGGIDNDGTLKLVESTVRDNDAGFPMFEGQGGGIYNDGGQLTLKDSRVEDNAAQEGGGIHNAGGTVVAINSNVSRNHGGPVASGPPGAYGNGIFNDGTLILIHTDVVGNTGGFDVANGGGIFNRGDARLVQSKVIGNTSFSSDIAAIGGGIYNGGSMTLTETPVSHNSVTSPGGHALGGGIANDGHLRLVKSPVFANVAEGFNADGGGVINFAPGHVTLIDSPVTGNIPNDCVRCSSGDGGALDPSFGTGGRVTTDFRPSPEFTFSSGGAAAIAIQGDGKIVAAGFAQPIRGATAAEFALARYNIDGSLDTTFGDSGEVTTEFGGGFDAVTRVFAVAIQRDGKIIAAGEAGSSESATGTDFALARYNSNGSLDATFGDGGKVTTDFGPGDGATAVAIQGDEKIIAVGFGGGGVALARYETDGRLDASFGDGGKDQNFGLSMSVTAAAMQQNGQIVVGGFAVNRELDFALARFNRDGSLDTSFGSGGEVTTDFAGSGDVSQAIAIQTNGRIVAAGYTEGQTDTDFALARYRSDGRLDRSFGSGGRVTTDFNGNRDSAAAVAIQRNGRIVAAGQTLSGAGGDFALTRYKTNGNLDPSFGSGGKISTDFGGSDDAAQALAIQRDGKLVAAGVTAGGGGSSFALARYLAG